MAVNSMEAGKTQPIEAEIKRSPHKVSRARAGLVALGLAIVNLACTVQPPATSNPTENPTGSPDQTPVVTPSGMPSPSENPTLSPEPTESLSPLEQNRLAWRNGTTPDFNVLTDHWLTPDGGLIYFGNIPYPSAEKDGDYYYTGRIIGAVEGPNGHILVIIGAEDGTINNGDPDVTYRLGDRMMIKETTSKDGLLELDGKIKSSRDFYNKVLDGSYLNEKIKFLQPFKPDRYRKDLFPLNFPGVAQDVENNITAANELHNFSLTIQTSDYTTYENPPICVNMDLTNPESIDINTLPYIFEVAVSITP